MSKKIKIIFFDWYKTLSSSTLFNSIADNKNLYKKLEDKIFGDEYQFVQDWMIGKLSLEEVISIVCSKDKDLSKEEIYKIIKTSSENLSFDSEEYLELIKSIKDKGIKVVIATDNMDIFERFTVPAQKLNDLFDDVLSSHNLKCVKDTIVNDKLVFFDDYLSNQGINYDETLFFDDTQHTLNLCKERGMKTFCVKNQMDLLMN